MRTTIEEVPEHIKTEKRWWVVMLWYAGQDLFGLLFSFVMLIAFVPRFLFRLIHELAKP